MIKTCLEPLVEQNRNKIHVVVFISYFNFLSFHNEEIFLLTICNTFTTICSICIIQVQITLKNQNTTI